MKIYDVFIDEAGMTPYFSDKEQRVLCIAGVITETDDSIFDKEAKTLFKRYKIDENTIFHAYPLVKGIDQFENLNKKERQELYLKFLEIGTHHISFIHTERQFKIDVRDNMIKKIKEMNLDPYLYTLKHFLIELDKYFIHKLENYNYRLYFHKSDNFKKQTKKMVDELCKNSEKYHTLQKIIDKPKELESYKSRYIQIADAIAFIMLRYYQFEMKNIYVVPKNIIKYEQFIMKCYDVIKSKILRIETIDNYHKLINPGELTKRDFKHVRNWTPKKRKPDKYDKNLKIQYKTNALKIDILNQTLEKFLDIASEVKKETNQEQIETMKKIMIEMEQLMNTSKSKLNNETIIRIGNNIKQIKEYFKIQ